MFLIDTNLLIYAHNQDSPFHEKASAFMEKALNAKDEEGNLGVCLSTQILMEFVNAITRHTLERPLSISKAIEVVNDYFDTGITVINQKETQLQTFLELLGTVTTRKKIFDIAIAATLKDNDINGLYTVNEADFKEFDFLTVINPLEAKP